MARLLVWSQGREWTVDAPSDLDRAELVRGLSGETVTHTAVAEWLEGHQRWLPTLDGIGKLGRVRRDAVVGVWAKDQ
ncbi:MAG TPA: hypothetical protein VFM96_13320 [Gaiellaceae bacterium]|nr:hypothetical protein [Gaiellaceae bacterium]